MWVTTDFGVTYSQVYIGEQYAIEYVFPHPRRDDLFLGILSSSCCYQPCNDYCSADVRVTRAQFTLRRLSLWSIRWVLIALITAGPVRGLRIGARHHREKIRQLASWHYCQLGQGRLRQLQRQLALRRLCARHQSRSGTYWIELSDLIQFGNRNRDDKRRILIPIVLSKMNNNFSAAEMLSINIQFLREISEFLPYVCLIATLVWRIIT